MNKAQWIISDTIHCQYVTSEYLEETIDLISTAFYPNENVCRTLKVADDPGALDELKDLTRNAADDGVTLIALDTTINKVVGAAINKIQEKDNPIFEKLFESWKRPKSRAVVQFMAEFDDLCNLFEHCQVNCLLEFMFLVTLPEYKGKGIGKKLTEATIEIGKALNMGINVKRSPNNKELPLEPVPKIMTAIFTTIATQKIGEQLGFKTVVEKKYAELEFQGTNFGSVVESGTDKITLAYRKLN